MKKLHFVFIFSALVMIASMAYAKEVIAKGRPEIVQSTVGVVTTTETLRVERMPPPENGNFWMPVVEDTGTGKFIKEYLNIPIAVEWKVMLTGLSLPDKGSVPKGRWILGVDENGNVRIIPSDIYQP